MSEPFLGQIQGFGFNFAPAGWALCNGQVINIIQNQALYALLGTTYGGDGKMTFGLPDLRGRAAIHFGSGAGLSSHNMGEKSGAETITLTVDQVTAHNHTGAVDVHGAVHCNNSPGNADSPISNSPSIATGKYLYSTVGPNTGMLAGTAHAGGNFTTSPLGSGQNHANMQPYLAINYCIAVMGIFPPRS